MERRELAGAVYRTSHLTGTFTLRSGATATEYFDKFRFESDPKLLSEIARQLVPLVPTGTDVLGGLEMGGIPIVTALSAATGLPAVFVRHAAKTYGTCKAIEGRDVDGANVCVVEDVVSSGGQIVLSTEDLRGAGATVEHALCVIDRRKPDAEDALGAAGLALYALFTMAEIEEAGAGS